MSFWVAYDAGRMRRTLKFLLRPQLRPTRILSGVLACCGIVLVMMDASSVAGYVAIVGGVVLVFAAGPINVARMMRMQTNALQEGCRMTIDDEWVQVAYPQVETKWRWTGFQKAVETPEVWYLMFGKVQALTIPKDAMTPEQRAEFAAFVTRVQPAWH